MENSIRRYGQQPYQIALLHGGPGAAGEMKPVAETLSKDFGVLECLQTEKIIATINSNNSNNETLKRLGELMTIADSFDYLPDESNPIEFNMEIYQSVWQKAAQLRDTNELINCTDKIECPIVVFHGEFDPHPIDGVEKPLLERVENNGSAGIPGFCKFLKPSLRLI